MRLWRRLFRWTDTVQTVDLMTRRYHVPEGEIRYWQIFSTIGPMRRAAGYLPPADLAVLFLATYIQRMDATDAVAKTKAKYLVEKVHAASKNGEFQNDQIGVRFTEAVIEKFHLDDREYQNYLLFHKR